jgi:hypothetical protein
VRVPVAVWEQPPLGREVCSFWKELLGKRNQSSPSHHHSSSKQDATDAKRAQALNLSVSARKSFRGGLQRPRHRRQRHDVADEVGQTVDGVGNQGYMLSGGEGRLSTVVLALAVEDVAADTLADGHAQVDVQADARDAHTGIVLVLGHKVCVVVMVVVRVAAVAARLGLRRAHGGGREKVLAAMGGRGPIEGGFIVIWSSLCRLCACAEDTQLPGYRGAPAQRVCRSGAS